MRKTKWWRKNRGDARPATLLKRAYFVVEKLGKLYTCAPSVDKDGIPEPPESGRHYRTDEMHIQKSDNGTIQVKWLVGLNAGTTVLSGDRSRTAYGYKSSVTGYRFGVEWVEYINDLYDELKSKENRVISTRWQDLD